MSEEKIPGDDSSPHQGDPAPQQWSGGSTPQSQEVRHSQVSALVPEGINRGVFSTGAVVLQGAHEFIIDFLQRMTSPRQLAARVVIPPAVVAKLIAALKENLGNYERNFGRPAALPTPEQKPTTQSFDSQQNHVISPSAEEQIQTTSQIVSPEQPVTPQATPQATPPGNGDTDSNHLEADTVGQPQQEPQPQTQSQQLPQNTAQELYDQLKLPDDVLSGSYANAVMIGHTQTEFCFDFITTFFPRSAVSCRVYLAAPNAARFLDALTHSFDQFQRKVQAQRIAQQSLPPQPPPSPER